MGTKNSLTQPLHSVEFDKGTSPSRDVTIGDSSSYPGLLVEPSIATYGNGVAVMTANFGDSNTVEAICEQLDILPLHTQSNTPYDKTTVLTAADPWVAVRQVVGKKYWLKGSSVTTIRGTKLVPAGSGLVKAMLAHTATALPMFTWAAETVRSSATWIDATFLGHVVSFTAA